MPTNHKIKETQLAQKSKKVSHLHNSKSPPEPTKDELEGGNECRHFIEWTTTRGVKRPSKGVR